MMTFDQANKAYNFRRTQKAKTDMKIIQQMNLKSIIQIQMVIRSHFQEWISRRKFPCLSCPMSTMIHSIEIYLLLLKERIWILLILGDQKIPKRKTYRLKTKTIPQANKPKPSQSCTKAQTAQPQTTATQGTSTRASQTRTKTN